VITWLNLGSVCQNQDAEKRLLCWKTERSGNLRLAKKRGGLAKKQRLWRKCEKHWREKKIIISEVMQLNFKQADL
jgi:hypothetical protein